MVSLTGTFFSFFFSFSPYSVPTHGTADQPLEPDPPLGLMLLLGNADTAAARMLVTPHEAAGSDLQNGYF